MKQLIILFAILPFLFIFIMQYSIEQRNHNNVLALQQLVYSAKELAKQDGCFTQKNVSELKKKISSQFNVDENEVVVVADSVPKYRVNRFDEREVIHYKVEVPIKNIMAGGAFLGISKQHNSMVYTIESHTASERLMP